MITINCCVCGKEYQIGSNELNRLWCSVGCQYGEDEVKCSHCNGECCYLDKREGTTRYAQMLPHGKGVHWCKHCKDGNKK